MSRHRSLLESRKATPEFWEPQRKVIWLLVTLGKLKPEENTRCSEIPTPVIRCIVSLSERSNSWGTTKHFRQPNNINKMFPYRRIEKGTAIRTLNSTSEKNTWKDERTTNVQRLLREQSKLSVNAMTCCTQKVRTTIRSSHLEDRKRQCTESCI